VAEAARGGSAGSVGLVLQTVLLPLALADGESLLTLRGGTHVDWAPSVSYLERVFLPVLAQMGACVEIELARWGFYPAGGGEALVRIAGGVGSLSPVQLTERGELRRVGGAAVVTNLPAHISQRMAVRARNLLAEAGLRAQVEPRRLRGDGPGAGIFLFAEYACATAGFTAYGRQGLPAERVAETACEELLVHHRSSAPADPYLADQLVLPLALAEGESRLVTSRVSQHLLTNVWVVRQFLARELTVEGEAGSPGALVVGARSPRPNGGSA
ncbi:MAG: RNA 3'-phosphate cyclase, partial [Chloroflexi bacterium]|nr:RNA 3'-phosphate cyclase [Chloroflexota bacterium]